MLVFCFFKIEPEEIAQQLSEGFVPDEAFMFSSQLMLDMDHIQRAAHSKGSQSFDGVCFGFCFDFEPSLL